MVKVLYASVTRSLMYAIMCTRLHIVYVVEVVSNFILNLGK